MRKVKIPLLNLRIEKPGTKIGDHTIELCGECNEPGIINDFFGTTVIFHGISAVPNEEDGALEIKDDLCIKHPETSPKPHTE
jgi:hypothetical protein